MDKTKKIILRVFIALCLVYVFCLAAAVSLSAFVKASVSERIISIEEAAQIGDVDCILVLGCGVKGETPSHMLEDRLLKGIELYEADVSGKMIMSGDHGRKDYDEVNVMKTFAMNKGIDSEDIFMDHAGFSTYDSMYRAKEIFEAEKIVIVTQKYHLYRALYIAEKLGIEAYGVNSDQRTYGKELYRETREILARDKDFVKCLIKPKSTYLGEPIPVNGNGNLTNDK